MFEFEENDEDIVDSHSANHKNTIVDISVEDNEEDVKYSLESVLTMEKERNLLRLVYI